MVTKKGTVVISQNGLVGGVGSCLRLRWNPTVLLRKSMLVLNFFCSKSVCYILIRLNYCLVQCFRFIWCCFSLMSGFDVSFVANTQSLGNLPRCRIKLRGTYFDRRFCCWGSAAVFRNMKKCAQDISTRLQGV